MRRLLSTVKRLAFGKPIATDALAATPLRTRRALPVFGAGVLSAVVYAPDAVVDALRRGSQQQAIPAMAIAVVAIMVLLGFAYRATVRSRPDARGDYGVVRDHLGPRAGLVTGAALLVDYLFTVAVSVAAMTQVLAYVLPGLRSWMSLTAVTIIAVMTLLVLRDARERLRVLAAVWFGFVTVIIVLVAAGMVRAGTQPTGTAIAAAPAQEWSVLVAYAGAIASGAVMITGIEHLASAGPAHRAPRGPRAGRTLIVAVLVSALAFLAVTLLAAQYRITGWSSGPVLLQVTTRIAQTPVMTWIVAAAAAAILYAAAVAVYRRFSHLAASLATDRLLPRQLAMRSDRQVLRGGILLIAAASAVLVVATGAQIEVLVHMYVVGVFLAVVLSQVAMVRARTAQLALATGGRTRTRLHAVRALHASAVVVAALVWIVVAVFNFVNGAWAAIALIVALILLMRAIRTHYGRVARDVRLRDEDRHVVLPSATHGLVLVATLHRPALRALAYAKAARHATLEAVAVAIDKDAAVRLQRQWGGLDVGVPLVILNSPYRDLVEPVLEYVRSIHLRSPREMVVVYVPEYIVGRWWESFLHNRATSRLRERLLTVDRVVVSAVPWHLELARTDPEALDDLDDEELP